MKRILLAAICLAAFHTTARDDISVRLHWNPVPYALVNLTQRSHEQELRGLLVTPHEVVFWDAYDVHHLMMIGWLREQGYDFPDASGIYQLRILEATDKLWLILDASLVEMPVIKRIIASGLFAVSTRPSPTSG